MKYTSAARRTFIYGYRLVNISAANVSAQQLTAALRTKLLQAACSTPDSRDTFLKRGVTLRYSYADSNDRHIADIDVKPADCGF
jgi:hypothetical protein